MTLISFVFPIYNEAENIPKLWEELNKAIKPIQDKYNFEFIFVNDGSSDKSIDILTDLYEKNSKTVKIINFSRNYGHQIAVTAGQEHAMGDAVIIMDSDLQDPPATCLKMIEKWEAGADIVYAKRRTYKTNIVKKLPAFVFYRLLKKITNVNIPVDTGDFRLLSKRVNQEMRKYKEKAKFLRGISSLTGFSQVAVEFDRANRFAGKPAYTFSKSLKLAIDGITSFSVFPLSVISLTGFIFSAGSFIFGFAYIVSALLTKTNISGWASLMAVTTFIGGIQLLMLGIIGEYVGRIYIQVLDRPLYTIKDTFGLPESRKE